MARELGTGVIPPDGAGQACPEGGGLLAGGTLIRVAEAAEDGDGLSAVGCGHVRERRADARGGVGQVRADQFAEPREVAGIRGGPAYGCGRAGIGEHWTPREQRHSFVSVLSDAGVDIEQIADAVGHVNSTITKAVYRHQIADEVTSVATAMDAIFGDASGS